MRCFRSSAYDGHIMYFRFGKGHNCDLLFCHCSKIIFCRPPQNWTHFRRGILRKARSEGPNHPGSYLLNTLRTCWRLKNPFLRVRRSTSVCSAGRMLLLATDTLNSQMSCSAALGIWTTLLKHGFSWYNLFVWFSIPGRLLDHAISYPYLMKDREHWSRQTSLEQVYVLTAIWLGRRAAFQHR